MRSRRVQDVQGPVVTVTIVRHQRGKSHWVRYRLVVIELRGSRRCMSRWDARAKEGAQRRPVQLELGLEPRGPMRARRRSK